MTLAIIMCLSSYLFWPLHRFASNFVLMFSGWTSSKFVKIGVLSLFFIELWVILCNFFVQSFFSETTDQKSFIYHGWISFSKLKQFFVTNPSVSWYFYFPSELQIDSVSQTFYISHLKSEIIIWIDFLKTLILVC